MRRRARGRRQLAARVLSDDERYQGKLWIDERRRDLFFHVPKPQLLKHKNGGEI
jgi:hypothetical protein